MCPKQDFINSLSDLNSLHPQLAAFDFFLGACYFRLASSVNTNYLYKYLSLLLSHRIQPLLSLLLYIFYWDLCLFGKWLLVTLWDMRSCLSDSAFCCLLHYWHCLKWPSRFSVLKSLLPYPISWIPLSVSETTPYIGISWVLLLYPLDALLWNQDNCSW